MPRRASKQSKSTDAAIALLLSVVTAIISAITLATVAYYKWASKISDSKRRAAAYLVPVGLIVVMSVVSLTTSSEQAVELTQPTAYEYNDDFEAESSAENQPIAEVEPEEVVVEPNPYVEPEPEAFLEQESEIAPEPIDTGLGYIDGTCKDLKSQGLGPFYPGDANYTSRRDRDGDGIACE